MLTNTINKLNSNKFRKIIETIKNGKYVELKEDIEYCMGDLLDAIVDYNHNDNGVRMTKQLLNHKDYYSFVEVLQVAFYEKNFHILDYLIEIMHENDKKDVDEILEDFMWNMDSCSYKGLNLYSHLFVNDNDSANFEMYKYLIKKGLLKDKEINKNPLNKIYYALTRDSDTLEFLEYFFEVQKFTYLLTKKQKHEMINIIFEKCNVNVCEFLRRYFSLSELDDILDDSTFIAFKRDPNTTHMIFSLFKERAEEIICEMELKDFENCFVDDLFHVNQTCYSEKICNNILKNIEFYSQYKIVDHPIKIKLLDKIFHDTNLLNSCDYYLDYFDKIFDSLSKEYKLEYFNKLTDKMLKNDWNSDSEFILKYCYTRNLTISYENILLLLQKCLWSNGGFYKTYARDENFVNYLNEYKKENPDSFNNLISSLYAQTRGVENREIFNNVFKLESHEDKVLITKLIEMATRFHQIDELKYLADNYPGVFQEVKNDIVEKIINAKILDSYYNISSDILKYYKEKGIDEIYKEKLDEKLLIKSISYDPIYVLEMIEKKPLDLDSKKELFATACWGRNDIRLELFQKLGDFRDFYSTKALHAAAYGDHKAFLMFLIDQAKISGIEIKLTWQDMDSICEWTDEVAEIMESYLVREDKDIKSK